jgi:hypothetical protein
MNDGGKGDARRPMDENKFRSNYDQIKWTVEEDEEFKRIESRDGDSLPGRPTPSNDLAG